MNKYIGKFTDINNKSTVCLIFFINLF